MAGPPRVVGTCGDLAPDGALLDLPLAAAAALGDEPGPGAGGRPPVVEGPGDLASLNVVQQLAQPSPGPPEIEPGRELGDLGQKLGGGGDGEAVDAGGRGGRAGGEDAVVGGDRDRELPG